MRPDHPAQIPPCRARLVPQGRRGILVQRELTRPFRVRLVQRETQGPPVPQEPIQPCPDRLEPTVRQGPRVRTVPTPLSLVQPARTGRQVLPAQQVPTQPVRDPQ